jgi:UDP-galactopyranose mutase
MSADFDLVCFSHLRWDFVFQRPQHLLSRCAREREVLFVEEPIFGATTAQVELRQADGVTIVVPHLSSSCSPEQACALQRQLLDVLLARRVRSPLALWYYTPMALPFTRHLPRIATVYDCMDELANFQGAPPLLGQLERELLGRADLVFTGGHSLYEHKRPHHPRVFPFPSSVDVPHFAAARQGGPQPSDQAVIPQPRLGFFGVIDERMDLGLLAAIATARPDWQLVMLGPVVKIDPATLPKLPNIHWLGGKTYKELPRYIAGWDVALLPFACNDATRFISPTKTPEYLAAGKPVVSTPIRDVIRPYGEMGLVAIAKDAGEFITAIEGALSERDPARQQQADGWLSHLSWDRTWGEMAQLIKDVAAQNAQTEHLRITSAAANARGVRPHLTSPAVRQPDLAAGAP